MKINIRKAKTSDMPAIIENWLGLMDQNKAFNPEAFRRKPNHLEIYKRFLLKQIKGRISAVYVAEEIGTATSNSRGSVFHVAEGIGAATGNAGGSGKIIGHIMLEIKKIPPIYEIDREAYVDELFVKDGFRGKGIGTSLLKEAEAWARRKGLRQLGLLANVKNDRARKVYAKFGLGELMLKMAKEIKY